MLEAGTALLIAAVAFFPVPFSVLGGGYPHTTVFACAVLHSGNVRSTTATEEGQAEESRHRQNQNVSNGFARHSLRPLEVNPEEFTSPDRSRAWPRNPHSEREKASTPPQKPTCLQHFNDLKNRHSTK